MTIDEQQKHKMQQPQSSAQQSFPQKTSQQKASPPQAQQPGSEQEMLPRPVTIRDSYRGSGKLLGKVAFISGGDSGIGRSVALHFAREGADIGILYLDEDDDAAETQRLIAGEGRRCLLNRGDCRSLDFC